MADTIRTMRTSNRATRAASLGLAAVVLCLAGLTIWAAYSTQARVDRAQRSASLHESYARASAVITEEESAELHYLLDPSPARLAALGYANEAFIAAVHQVTQRGGQADAQTARNLLALHGQYLSALERLLGEMAIGNLEQARRIDTAEADPLFSSMQVLLTAATEQRLAEAEETFAVLNATASRMLIAAPVVFAIGFLLLLGLWRVLNESDRARQRTYREIEQLSRLRGEFVSTVSHEFRTPLTGIQGFSEMMRDEVLTVDLMREYAGDINKDAQRLNRLINDMLDLDRLESGEMTLNVHAVDLNRILVDAAAQFRSSASAPDHPIALNLDERLPTLSGDHDRMTQVVNNLISNAIKYSPNGGAVELRTKREARTIVLTVRDHGIGIPTEQLEKIFERYARIETTNSLQGTGLGLPIVRHIVQLFDGKVWATSESGEGSVFHVQLPLPTTTVAHAA